MKILSSLLLTAALCAGASYAADAAKDEEIIKDVMKKYHKAPQGQDHLAKKAAAGKASPAEVKELVAAYGKMAETTHPPKGDEKSWKEKTSTLFAAAKGLEKGDAASIEAFKKASDCRGCHQVHRPPQQ